MPAPRSPLVLSVLLLELACAHTDPPPVAAAPPAREVAIVAPLPPPGPEADARAEAAFRKLEPQFEAVLAIPIDDPTRLKAALTLKLRAFAELERGYQAIAALGSRQWTVAAMVRLGEAYEELARAVREAPAPAGLTAEQLELFRSELAARARPLDEKAADAYQRAISLEEPSVAPSEWGQFARERLSKQGKP